MNAIAARLRATMEARGIGPTELARLVGVQQGTISKITSGRTENSRYLVRIARELGTTPAYLTGEIDDPDAGAAPPPPSKPARQVVSMDVLLPAQPALARMFEGLIRSLGEWQAMPVGELADELAMLLPSGLGVLRAPLRYEQSADEDDELALAEEPAAARIQPRRARRT